MSATSPQFPQRYGADDTLGALNEVTAHQVLRAASLVKQGRRYALSRLLESDAPTQLTRFWKNRLELERLMPGHQVGANMLSSVEETISGAMHSGTHMDGLGHIGIGVQAYNGNAYADIVTTDGLTRLGIENVPPVMTRGILLDIARLKNVEMLADNYPITAQDLDAAAALGGVTVEAGDVVLLHTGWGKLWLVDNARYGAGEPGLNLDAAAWCTDRRVSAIGADTWAVEVVPNADEREIFPVHQHCITKYGCYLIENVELTELAADRVYEFCFVVLPLRAKGASASPVSPVAIV
jgi:kynurenine formamidase